MHFFHQGIARICVFFLLLTTTFIFPDGFPQGTYIQTPSGFNTIENLEPGHEVISFDHLKKIYAKNIVLQRHKQTTQDLLHIHYADNIIKTDAEQRFLDADTYTWYPAHALRVGQHVVADNHTSSTITRIDRKQSKQASVLYALSLRDGPHNFCVTKDKIVAHNIEPVSALIALYKVFT